MRKRPIDKIQPPCGTEAPVRPVRAPAIVSGVLLSDAAFTIWRTSSVVVGAKAFSAFPCRPEASSRYSGGGTDAEVTVYLYDRSVGRKRGGYLFGHVILGWRGILPCRKPC